MAMASGAVVSDLDAFEQVVRSNSQSLYSLARAILGDQQEAEDAVQDTMEIAWRSWRSLRDPQRRSAWLKRICVRRCLRVKRRLFSLLLLALGCFCLPFTLGLLSTRLIGPVLLVALGLLLLWRRAR